MIMGVAVSAAVDLLVALLENAQQISQLIQTAQANGQTSLTPEQWATVTGNDDSAEAALNAAIAAAKSAGR
jgi:tellurite resistance protein